MKKRKKNQLVGVDGRPFKHIPSKAKLWMGRLIKMYYWKNSVDLSLYLGHRARIKITDLLRVHTVSTNTCKNMVLYNLSTSGF